jgi:hypothetical protein
MSFLKKLLGKDKPPRDRKTVGADHRAISTIVHARQVDDASNKHASTQVDPDKLHHLLVSGFSEGELRDLCLHLGIDYDHLPGEGLTRKTRELIAHYTHPPHSIDTLVQICSHLYPNVPWDTPTTARYEPYGPGTRSKLSQLLDYCFNESELRDLCLDLRIDYDDLPGAGKAAKIRELVQYFARPTRSINELVQVCSELRPNAPWNIPTTTKYELYSLDKLAELRRMLTEHFDEKEVRDLCASLGVDARRLPGVDQGGTARELVLHLARRERIVELVEICSQRRSDVPWQNTIDNARDERAVGEANAQPVDLARLRQMLTIHFNEDQLRDLCLEMGIDYDDLPGPDKVRELVMHFDRRKRIPELAEACARLRPDVPW